MELVNSDFLFFALSSQLNFEQKDVVNLVVNFERKAVYLLELKGLLLRVHFLFGFKSDETKLVIFGDGIVVILIAAVSAEVNLILESGNIVSRLIKSD